MRRQLTIVRADIIRLLQAAALALAMAFALSCSSDDSGGCDSVTSGTFEDARDGTTYKTTKICTQTWFAQNLNYDVPSNNTDVCYDNDPANCAKYGRLYNWETAMTACPSGWHLPTDADWKVLFKFANPSCSDNSSICAGVGTKLKAREGWDSYSGVPSGTDEFGFAALPGGSGSDDGSFYDVGKKGEWWSANEEDGINFKNFLYSVRCLQD